MSNRIYDRKTIIKTLEQMGMKDETTLVRAGAKSDLDGHNELMNPQRRFLKVFKNKPRSEQARLLADLVKSAESIKQSRQKDEDLLNTK